jgi:hypothetical protein
VIKGLFGLAHIGLAHFHSLCKQEKLSYAIANPMGLTRIDLGEKNDPYPIIVLTVVNFLKIHKRFHKQPVCIFVIDNPIQLEAIGATILSCTKILTYHYQFHSIRSQDIRIALDSCGEEPIELKIKKTKVIFELLKIASAESILSPLQTAFYQIKDVESRSNLQDAVFDWLGGKSDVKMIVALKGITNRVSAEKISILMNHPNFQRLRVAAKAVVKDGLRYEVAAKRYKTTIYDLKYICKKAAAKMNIVLPG